MDRSELITNMSMAQTRNDARSKRKSKRRGRVSRVAGFLQSIFVREPRWVTIGSGRRPSADNDSSSSDPSTDLQARLRPRELLQKEKRCMELEKSAAKVKLAEEIKKWQLISCADQTELIGNQFNLELERCRLEDQTEGETNRHLHQHHVQELHMARKGIEQKVEKSRWGRAGEQWHKENMVACNEKAIRKAEINKRMEGKKLKENQIWGEEQAALKKK